MRTRVTAKISGSFLWEIVYCGFFGVCYQSRDRFISFFAGIKSEPRYDVCSNSPHLRKYAYFGETRNPELLSTTVYGNPMVALVSPLVSKTQLSPSRRFDSTPACDRQTDRQTEPQQRQKHNMSPPTSNTTHPFNWQRETRGPIYKISYDNHTIILR